MDNALVSPDTGIGLAIAAGVATITMDRSAQRNAMSAKGVDRMIELLGELNDLSDCRSIILTGAGRGFCAGSDLGELSGMAESERIHFERRCGQLSRMLSSAPKPVIAAVHGFAIGGGLTLAASCDIVISTAEARWSLPEVPIGLFPAWGLSPVVRRCGVVAAQRLTWGIDTLDGRGALSLRLADEVVDDPAATALTIAQKLAALPAAQSTYVKKNFMHEAQGEAADELSNQLFIRSTNSPEALKTFAKFSRGSGAAGSDK